MNTSSILSPLNTHSNDYSSQSNQSSQSSRPAAIAMLVNENVLDDMRIFMDSLQLWTPFPPPLYIYTTRSCVSALQALKKKLTYEGRMFFNTALDTYGILTRTQMEHAPSKKGYANLFYDFTLEKTHCMEWALEDIPEINKKQGVLFCDADICWFGPCPTIPSLGYSLAVSPHEICPSDEKKYGIYNAGYLWTNTADLMKQWRDYTQTSHFYEQASIETLVNSCDPKTVFRFGVHHNYGWWRMFQSYLPPSLRQSQWSIFRSQNGEHSGLVVDGAPLVSIHTHFHTNDMTTNMFNVYVRDMLKKLQKQPKTRTLSHILSK